MSSHLDCDKQHIRVGWLWGTERWPGVCSAVNEQKLPPSWEDGQGPDHTRLQRASIVSDRGSC